MSATRYVMRQRIPLHISEILDFAPGKIIELNKIAGEPIDVLVNGKYVARGEVVVIEESFGAINSNAPNRYVPSFSKVTMLLFLAEEKPSFSVTIYLPSDT